jgi:predicted chitinase
MDYNAGEYLNHRQWQWSHEKHRNVLGFLDDEGESEERNNDNERILSILKEIREANQKDEAMLNISVNQSMTYTIDVPNANFTLGEGTLSYLKIENDKLSITEAETTIAPNELSEVVLEDKEYTKIVFHKTTSVGISEDVAFSIIVKTKEKQTLISYIHPYKITTEQLSNIYPNASTQTIKAVTEAINKYCNEFEINTPERMAHFLGQIGAETGDKLNKLSESPSYTARRIVEIFGYNKYGHLFEEAVLDETTYNYSYTPIDYSCSSCRTEAIDKGNSTFSMDETKIINAYAEIKEEKEVVINGQKVKKMLFNETPRTDVVREGENKTISKYVSNESYSDGRLRVKKQYIKSATLFDVTYACRMGNGAIETRDGSVYAGVGFIHLTGKSNYNDVIDFWNKMHPDDKLTLNHELIERAKTDVDLAMKLAMAYWKSKRVNKSVKSKTYNESESNKISYEINGGTNGRDSRQKNTKKAFDVLSK